jgi:hypothetical protein
LTDLCRGDGRPLLFVFDFGVAEKLVRFRVKKNGLVLDAMVFQNFFQLGPDRVVAFFVFLLGTGSVAICRACAGTSSSGRGPGEGHTGLNAR